METLQSKKITLSTVKSFIKKNRENLFINVKSSFDGMTDGVEQLHNGFTKIKPDKTISINSDYYNSTQNIQGAWFVGSSRDYFTAYNSGNLTGFEISNFCGTFILAIPNLVL
jgi:hypothetical protein